MTTMNASVITFFEKMTCLEYLTNAKQFANIYVYAFLNEDDLIDIYMFNTSYFDLNDCVKIENQVLNTGNLNNAYVNFLELFMDSNIDKYFIVDGVKSADLKQIIAIATKKFTISNALSTQEIKANVVHLIGGHDSLSIINFIYESNCLTEKDNRQLQMMRNQNAINYPPSKYSAPFIIQKQQTDYKEIFESLDQENIRALKKFD